MPEHTWKPSWVPSLTPPFLEHSICRKRIMLYLTYKNHSGSPHLSLQVCVHASVCAWSWSRYAANWQSQFEGSMWVISLPRVWCRGVARTLLLLFVKPFHKISALSPRRCQSFHFSDRAQTSHLYFQTWIVQHMLWYATWPPAAEILKVPLSLTDLHSTLKNSRRKCNPWLDQAAWNKVWRQIISCYSLALKDLRPAQQCYCPPILVSWSATEEQESCSAVA